MISSFISSLKKEKSTIENSIRISVEGRERQDKTRKIKFYVIFSEKNLENK